MPLVNDTQAVTDTPTRLGTLLGGRKLVAVRNPAGGDDVYIGGSDVDADNAMFHVTAGSATLVITDGEKDSLAGEEWYVVCDTAGTATIAVGEA